MPIGKYIQRLRHIDCLMRNKGACSASVLAKKIKLSRSSTLEHLNEMRKLGFPIIYSRKEKCYKYSKQGEMTKHLFQPKKII